MKELGNKILAITFILFVIGSTVASYYRYIIKEDFVYDTENFSPDEGN